MNTYAELAASTNYSFLHGASHPSDMVARAVELGLSGIGIADRNSVAGVVRAHVALRDAQAALKATGDAELPFRLVVGTRLVFADGTPDVIAYPVNRPGWGRLTRLLSTGNLRAEKGGCVLNLPDLLFNAADLLLILLPDDSGDIDALDPPLSTLRTVAADRLWLGATMPRGGQDRRRLAMLSQVAARARVPLLATNAPLYALPEDRPLHDILACIRAGTTIRNAGRRLAANAEAHLKSPAEMARLFADRPEALAEIGRLLARIEFSLDQLRYEYPHEPVPEGWTPQGWLEHLAREAARERYGDPLPEKVERLLADELTLIGQLDYAPYFLTVHDIVRFARSRGILCQGRGSAANSTVCFVLGITSVDPMAHSLLFSRFISAERAEPPDIDVDFEHERREEVMQYIYARYGRERAGIAATVIHYRPRSAVREVGKALGLSEDVTTRLTSTIWGSFSSDMPAERIAETGFDITQPDIIRLKALVDRLLTFPRHLSQHVGGFVLTEGRLDELVPIHNGAMADRTFIEWDKDDIDALGLMKVDVLALGMLTAIRKCFDLLRAHDLGDYALDTIPAEDPATYAMLCRGDSIGVFQVESRAQINMLPRLRPREFYDLVVQVAIVRPGPIEGDMVHPYLRRRNAEEPVVLPSPGPAHDQNELKDVLGKTFGVPLFQEQAMKLAIVAAGFTPDEANALRRAMATFRNVGTMPRFHAKMVEGMVARGYERDFAERCFRQIEGFGSYGFPESHAQSFARLVYVSSWLKCHHPAAFAAALLNSQPMGFYAPAQLVRDAAEHGVAILPIDINHSAWDCTLEAGALRLGMRMVDGFREAWAGALVAARETGAFESVEALARRARLPATALQLLAEADAFGSLALNRRDAIWDVRRTPNDTLPLFAAADARELGEEPDAELPPMPLGEAVAADYQSFRLSLKGHPMALLRHHFAGERVLTSAETSAASNGARVRTAGVVLVRQRPGKGNAIFITIEDETGITNALLWARDFERQRTPVMASRLMLIEGVIQRSKEGVVHLMTQRVHDRSHLLTMLSDQHDPRPPLSRGDEVAHLQPERQPLYRHPRDVRILPHSRDFH
ncbi:error-prone DNA polymerase [Sandaracinobacteroides saxicola]|uniref:Error-prone DNA polymerase n=1 Tax=Sandaracinobacteroides saxicola TaxID=2759707 RepID=A0A7G5IGJ3_9SPHN|nr:error-prone DNA polymerase [Sandaracinobacteroides saxicola]QMW22485.1 error-prone DNA polymerase [Sandaracinobacteroides saxicola]